MLEAVRDLPFFERRADQIREELNRNPDVKKHVALGGGVLTPHGLLGRLSLSLEGSIGASRLRMEILYPEIRSKLQHESAWD